MRKTPRGWIQISESRTRGVARIPLGLKPSRDSRATSQRDSPIWIQPLGVFRYKSDAVLLNDQLFENKWYCQRCHNKQFLNPVRVFMANNNVDKKKLWSYMTPSVIFIMSAPGSGKLRSHNCRIRWKIFLDIGITNKFYWQIFLSILYFEYHLAFTHMIVCVSFEEIYSEQSSPCPVLEWRCTIFITFQLHIKIFTVPF